MLFYITHNYYGGDANLIAQAAQQNGAELIAVKGYALKDLPGDREYVEGPAEYIFKLERASHPTLREGVVLSPRSIRVV